MHVVQASLMMYSLTTGDATCMTAMLLTIAQVAKWLGTPDHYSQELTILLFVTATLAMVGVLFRLGRIRLAIFLPQNVVLGVMMVGGICAAWQGAYLDGTVIPWPHILADQLWTAILLLVHTRAIVKRAQDPNG